MSLVYITGLSGSGKSTVLRELAKRSFEAHGVDEEGFADWVDRKTDKITPFPHDDPNLDIHDWYKKHRWVLSVERIAELKEQSDKANRTIFLSGVAEGDDRVWHLFDKVIVLSVDEATIRHRIENREENQFGKDPEEMAEILGWLENYDETYRGFGAIIVDATRPLNEVVDEVMGVIKPQNKH